MYRILDARQLAGNLYQMDIEAPLVARHARPGQFLILRENDTGERLPFTICDSGIAGGRGVRIIFQTPGASTRRLAKKKTGEYLSDVAGPLGRPTDFGGARRIICVGGGVGAAVLYPQVDFLHKEGCYVEIIEGARNKDLLLLEEEFSARCDILHITTDDGSQGEKGLVTDVLKRRLAEDDFDLVIAIGPPIMMKVVCEVTRPLKVPTMVSLNPIMLDGTGMCGCCRVTVGGKVRYACVDGPEFDGHQVNFDEMMMRLRMYRPEEEHACRMLAAAEEARA